jgi:hypothetical protein
MRLRIRPRLEGGLKLRGEAASGDLCAADMEILIYLEYVFDKM